MNRDQRKNANQSSVIGANRQHGSDTCGRNPTYAIVDETEWVEPGQKSSKAKRAKTSQQTE